MGATIPNLAAVRAAALSSIGDMEARFRGNVRDIVHEADRLIKAKTPVNTGQAVRNMIWTNGAGSSVVHEAIDNGEPGPTNSMALGNEPRRGVNEAAAAESLKGLDFTNPFGAFTLTNNSPDIVGLEAGIYPGAPLTSRSPAGMFGITSAFLSAKLKVKGILS